MTIRTMEFNLSPRIADALSTAQKGLEELLSAQDSILAVEAGRSVVSTQADEEALSVHQQIWRTLELIRTALYKGFITPYAGATWFEVSYLTAQHQRCKSIVTSTTVFTPEH